MEERGKKENAGMRRGDERFDSHDVISDQRKLNWIFSRCLL
jgi:hypothetical protein